LRNYFGMLHHNNRWYQADMSVEYLSEDENLRRRLSHVTHESCMFLLGLGLSSSQIAHAFGCSSETVNKRLRGL
jgi:DNA-directed RNA polymerase specialized sigma24 family protein